MDIYLYIIQIYKYIPINKKMLNYYCTRDHFCLVSSEVHINPLQGPLMFTSHKI